MTVPRLFPGGVVACIATGPSLRQADVDLVRTKVDGVVVVNDAYTLCPSADVLVAADVRWWQLHKGVPAFRGLKVSVERGPKIGAREHAKWPDIMVLRHTGRKGLELDPTGLRTGQNSGALAIGVAVHLGAAKVILLGYDCCRDIHGRLHFFGNHAGGLQNAPPLGDFITYFTAMVEPLKAAGVTVINCSRRTKLHCFPQMSLAEV